MSEKEFINKSIQIARKMVHRDKHRADRYLRTRRFMFHNLFPGHGASFIEAVQKAFNTG